MMMTLNPFERKIITTVLTAVKKNRACVLVVYFLPSLLSVSIVRSFMCLSAFPCHVPVCCCRGRLARAGSGSHSGVELWRSRTGEGSSGGRKKGVV
jgi:hypothetical protein